MVSDGRSDPLARRPDDVPRDRVPATPTGNCFGDTFWLTLLAALAYFLLQQRAIHHVDANAMVRALALPHYISGYAHFGYRAVLEFLHALSDHGAPIHGTLLALSSVAAALAVGAAHRACVACRLDRGQAILATSGAASCMAWVYFATVVEIHGVFLLPAMCTWWALARCWQRPGPGRAVPVGLASGVATAVHYSGVVLPLLGLLCLRALQRTCRLSLSKSLLLWGAWVAVHAASFCLLHGLVSVYSGAVDDGETLGFLRDRFDYWSGGLGPLATMAWYEWLWPFAPWSAGFLVAWQQPPLRRAALAMVVAWLGYLAMDWVNLLSAIELGAYALPMALPAAALCAIAWPRNWMAVGVAASLAISIGSHFEQDPARIPAPGFGQGLHAFHRENPRALFVLGGYAELDSVLVYAPPTPHHSIYEAEFRPWLSPATSETAMRALLTARVQRATADGGCFVFSAEALSVLESLPRNQALLAELGQSFAVEPVERGAFRGIAVRERPR